MGYSPRSCRELDTTEGLSMHIKSCPSITKLCIAFSAHTRGFPCGSAGKESACNAGDLGSIPGLERSPGEGNGNPYQYSCLGNPMERGSWWATPKSPPTRRGPPRGTPRVTALPPLSPFSPPDRDRRGDSHAWSGRGSRPSRRTSG